MALILVVEDSPTQTYSLKRILTKYGHKVITAEDGVQGVELAKRELPDLILMDIVMPRLNGFQATRLLTKDVKTSHIPIILVTNKDQETDEIWGRRQGAKRYVTKPFDEDSLMRDIHELLATPSRLGKV
jgi:twitching motility two-component system response regulator PilH